jgi:hypothetical protein
MLIIAPCLASGNRLAARTLRGTEDTSRRQGDHVTVEGSLVSSSFERQVRKEKKNATVKQLPWPIGADAVR